MQAFRAFPDAEPAHAAAFASAVAVQCRWKKVSAISATDCVKMVELWKQLKSLLHCSRCTKNPGKGSQNCLSVSNELGFTFEKGHLIQAQEAIQGQNLFDSASMLGCFAEPGCPEHQEIMEILQQSQAQTQGAMARCVENTQRHTKTKTKTLTQYS